MVELDADVRGQHTGEGVHEPDVGMAAIVSPVMAADQLDLEAALAEGDPQLDAPGARR